MLTRVRTGALIISACCALLVGGMCVLVMLFPTVVVHVPFMRSSAVEQLAQQAVAACKTAGYRPPCYDTRVPQLLDAGVSMEDAFLVTRRVQQLDPTFVYCHVLGHNIAAKETAKDPSKWTEVIARCPSGTCENGCQHGAIQQRFRTDAMTPEEIDAMLPELAQLCVSDVTKKYTGNEEANCYHGLGHLGMYATGGDMEASLQICERIDTIVKKPGAVNDVKEHCYEGAFMQVFQFLDDEDRALVGEIAPKTIAEADAYCAQFTGARKAACHRENWPLNWETIKTPEGLATFCAYMPEAIHMQYCYNVLLNVITAMFNYRHTAIAALCEKLPKNRMGQCFGHAAFQFLHSDDRLSKEAVKMCDIAESHGVGPRCYGELLFYSGYGYHEGSASFKALCTALPEPWRTKCRAGEGKNISSHVLDT